MKSSVRIDSKPIRRKRHNKGRFPKRPSLELEKGRETTSPSRLSNPREGFHCYLREIGKTPLLSREQEIELAERFKKGDQSARDLMIRSNLRLVVKIAHDYKNYGLPIMDLISEGNIGLMKAVERFDPDKGGKLSTYASWWIKQAIKRALANQSKTIRLPVHLVDKISRIRKAASRLTEEFGREPTDEELADVLGIPVHKIAHFKSVSTRPASLNAPVSEDGQGTEFGELVGDENARSPFDYLDEKSVRGDLSDMFNELEERESEIIRLRFGIERDSPLTLEEVGRIFGITRERVRQLQNIALQKMRRIMSNNERQFSLEEVKQINRNRERMLVFGEFFRKSKIAQNLVH